jgi:hypothetical protein
MFELARLLDVLSMRAAVPADFQRMLDWKLLRGSHEFPGPDGGTCVNEAAIVAAGYPYHAVYCVKDLPVTFSRPIALLALCLNDTLEDDLRQELLLPFVTRLAGSADTPKIEMTRAELMLQRTVAEMLAPALARAGFVDLAERSRRYRTPTDLVEVARHLRDCTGAALPQSLIAAFDHAADAGRQWLWGLPNEVVFCTFAAMREIASLEGGRFEERVYRRAADILEAALAIGNCAEGDAADVVVRRMDVAKRVAEAAHAKAPLPAA